MAESLELPERSRYERSLQEHDAPYDTGSNGAVIVSDPNPIAPIAHRTTSISNDTSHQREASPVQYVEPIQSIDLPARPLEMWDVASLIINKMIGTGIFTAPPTVLLMAGSPGLAFGLWLLGFVYTIISMLVYLEYARKLPHTGGELIYIDETLPTPLLLTYTIYAFYFVVLFNTATNCMRFADFVLRCATDPNAVEDERLLRFLAVVILTLLCALHYRSARMARRLNVTLAGLKIVILLVVMVAGAVKASKEHTSWSQATPDEASSTAAAFLLILFSFGGWENATFVTGEIRSHEILKRGFIAAVLAVGLLYLLVNIVFLSAVSYSDIVIDYVPWFFGNSLGAQKAWDVIIAISAAGSLLSVIYTSARVKQAISKSNSIPWSRLWSIESPYKTPEGGLLIHWIFSVILIAATAAINNLSEAISFPGSLQAYATGFIGVIIAIGFPFLRRKSIPDQTRLAGEPAWSTGPGFFDTTIRRVCMSAIYIVFNSYIVVVTAIPPYQNPDGSPREIKGWVYSAAAAGTIVAGLLYYFAAFFSGDWSLIRAAKARATITVEENHDATYGCRKYVEITLDNPRRPSLLYRLFGGHLTGRED